MREGAPPYSQIRELSEKELGGYALVSKRIPDEHALSAAIPPRPGGHVGFLRERAWGQ